MQHFGALESGDIAYPTTKHMANAHPEEMDSERMFATRILGSSHIDGNLKRYLTETVLIAE